jgi:hypothetical protein
MKKTLTTITLATILAFGATFANAGIIIGDQHQDPCNTQTDGIIIGDFFTKIISSIEGIIIGDAPKPCSQTDGIIIAG